MPEPTDTAVTWRNDAGEGVRLVTAEDGNYHVVPEALEALLRRAGFRPVDEAAAPAERPAPPACPLCPDGHPSFESRPWSVWVSDPPVKLTVSRADGRHVAEQDAERLREILRGITAAPEAPWAPSWAKVGAQPCVTVKCSHCGDPYENDDFGTVLHFDTVDEALKAALAAGWVQDSDRLLDQSCAGRLVCARDGHSWDDGHASVEWTGSDGTVHKSIEWWMCRVCGSETNDQPDLPATPDPSAPTLFDGAVEAGEPS
jgi:hypothetical protein